MKRDINLIRKILLNFENDETFKTENDGDMDLFFKHCQMLIEAGLLSGIINQSAEGIFPIVTHITWNGYEVLDLIRDETRWNKAKAIVRDKQHSISFELFMELLLNIAKTDIGLE